jgi:esterase/lipase
MANETLYPFGGGHLPSGFPVADDCHTDRGDISLSARQGKLLQEQINRFNLGETQTYGKLVPMNTYSGKIVNAQGELADGSYSLLFVNEFPIDLVNQDYIASYGYGAAQTSTYTLNYYDESWNYLGGAVINPGGDAATAFTMIPLEYPSSWQSDLDTYKAQAKFLRITGYTGSREGTLYETWTIPRSILASAATPNEILTFATMIQSPMMRKITNNNVEIETTEVVSPWGIIFPETYSVSGKRTPVIAMLHGSNGYVAEGVLGYSSGGWVTQREQYLAAGFAVMDINGYGVSTEADAKSKHWGCPLAIETLDKAWEFIKQNFNVCDKLLVHGTSMGGVLAMSYTKCFPGKVAAVGLFAPNLFAYSARYIEDSTKYTAWGYADHAEAEADEYKELTGYVLLNECQVADGDTGVISQFEWSDYPYADREQVLTKRLIDRFPVQMRIWQGSADTSVYPSNSTLLFNALMRGNSPVSIRICYNNGHDLAGVSYVRNEAVSWFKRFISTQTITD